MNSIHNLIGYFPAVHNGRVLALLSKKRNITLSGGGNHNAKAFTFSDVVRKEQAIATTLWVVNETVEQEHMARALRLWTDQEVTTYNILPFDSQRARFSEADNHRNAIEFVYRLCEGKRRVIVAPYADLVSTFPDIEEIREKTVSFNRGASLRVTDLFEKLIELGYEVSDAAELDKGTYSRRGEIITIFPLGFDYPVRMNTAFDSIESIGLYDPENDEIFEELDDISLIPAKVLKVSKTLSDLFAHSTLVVEDELDVIDEFYEAWNTICDESHNKIYSLGFVSFNEDDQNHQHLHYLSVLKYRGAYDLVNDLKEKQRDAWQTVIFTKDATEIKGILGENNFQYHMGLKSLSQQGVVIVEAEKEDVLPHAFQNPQLKLMFVTDREVSSLREEKKKHFNQKVYMDFLTSLKMNDFVVHAHHGIGKFLGLEKRTVDNVTREYLKIGYAENDKLFVPIDQADKVNKFIGADEQPPKLTRLGSAEWNTLMKKVQKETEAIAQELLVLYAQRKSAKGFTCKSGLDLEQAFDEAFDYEETPGQMKAIIDVRGDLAKSTPMDRLVCGDVGFGKTEVAMRAAFRVVQSKKQVAVVSPITILADQHYRSFQKRMEGFHVRVEMLSRFRSAAEQKEILKKMEKGEIDIVIGTHRLLQADIKFKDLGLVIVDEEQRFGVKQKETLKQLKAEVHFLTLTATPIPRTLNFALNKLRDISTITTPPPGRLPIITEVRRYSQGLIREAILREVARGGQIYFLHNRVQTIDGVAEKLRSLVPEAKFGVAHGKLGSGDLEERIVAFKDHQFDVLVSSTIIENGIDLANANTLIVNNAEKLGLAQLYQLRGRVGRGKTQAYAYFLYHGQRLKLDAKKRLRAIVEASELGSGFQIAMKDLEIRGAGDVLGVKQHGSINVVGVSHFIRMLNKAVDDLKAGKVMREEEPEDVSIELPLTAYIPDSYIVSPKEKINAYQKMSSADTLEYLTEIKDELLEDYGKMPTEVLNLVRVLELKILAKRAKLVSVKAENVAYSTGKEIVLHMSGLVKPENIMNVLEHNSQWYISGTRLRAKTEDLGLHWFDALRESVKYLGESVKIDEKVVKSS